MHTRNLSLKYVPLILLHDGEAKKWFLQLAVVLCAELFCMRFFSEPQFSYF